MSRLYTVIDSLETEQVKLLERLVGIDSGTDDKPGVDAVGDLLSAELRALGLAVETVPQEAVGNHVVGRKPGTAGRQVLLVGHMDTVFSKGTVQQRPFRIDGNRAFGPGVYDMKGGLVVLLFALRALKSAAPATWETLGLRVLFNSDEETGSDTSRKLIAQAAQQVGAACILEPARPTGEYVSRRKGVGSFKLTVEGMAAHAGVQPELGANAIAELAAKVTALQTLTNFETGLSVNVGVIRGGERSNVVPAFAECEMDVRAPSLAAMDQVQADLRRIAETVAVPGTRTTLAGGFKHYPMELSPSQQRLFDLLAKAGADIGLDVKHTATGGGSDGNNTSQYTPTLDGMGPRGNFAHGPQEYVELDSLPERAKILARFLDLWAQT